MSRTMLPLALVALLAVTGVADAKHKKPITKSFEATGLAPNPTGGSMCDPSVHPMDRHVEPFRAPEAGTFNAQISGFVGDYDVVLYDDKGTELARGDNAAGTSTGNPSDGTLVEKLKYNFKRPTNAELHVCNFAGGPTVKGSYTFTYLK